MNRKDFYKYQIVGQDDLDGLEDSIELADAHGLDAFSLGALPIRGLAPTADGATLALAVSAGIGIAADSAGDPEFVKLTAPGTISLAGAVPLANPRWVLLALHFIRYEHQQVVDGDNVTLQYLQDESSELLLVQGVEGGGKPAIPIDCVPIVDVQLAVAQAALHTTDLDLSRARPAFGKQGTAGGVAAQVADLASLQLDNCRGYVVEPPSLAANLMKVGVRPGAYNLSDRQVAVAGGMVTIPPSPTGAHHRITLVYLDANGAPQLLHGAEVVYAVQAVPPSFEGVYPVAIYDVLDTTTSLLPASLVDVRPHARAVRDTPNRYKFTAGGGEVAVTIAGAAWTFIVGAHALQVYKNGLLLPESAYTENADGSGIHGLAALAGADVIELVAPRVAGVQPVVTHAPTHAADGSDPIDYSSIGGLVLPGFEAYTVAANIVAVKPFAAVINGKLRASTSDLDFDFDANPQAANAWLYFYAAWVAGAMVLELSATPPDNNRRLKQGDPTRTFLFPVMTTGGANHRPLTFWLKNRHIHYSGALSSYDDPGNQVDNGCIVKVTGDNVGHDQSVAGFFPPWVNVGRYGVRAITTNAAGDTAQILGGGVGGYGRVMKLAVTSYETDDEMTLMHGTTQVVRITNSNALVVTRLYAIGYEF